MTALLAMALLAGLDEPRSPVILRGILVVDGGRGGPVAGYSLRVEAGGGSQPVVMTYRLITTHIEQPAALSRAVGRTIKVLGRVGERPDQYYLLVEALLEP